MARTDPALDAIIEKRRRALNDNDNFILRVDELRQTFSHIREALSDDVVADLQALADEKPRVYSYIKILENVHLNYFCPKCNSPIVDALDFSVCSVAYESLLERMNAIKANSRLSDEEFLEYVRGFLPNYKEITALKKQAAQERSESSKAVEAQQKAGAAAFPANMSNNISYFFPDGANSAPSFLNFAGGATDPNILDIFK